MCSNVDHCVGVIRARVVAFFAIVGSEEIAEGTINDFFKNGFDSLSGILSATVDDIKTFDGYQDKKAIKVHENLHNKLKDISIPRLMHASSCFPGIGEETFNTIFSHISIGTDNIDNIKIPGIGVQTKLVYRSGYFKFIEFFGEIGDYISVKEQVVNGTSLAGWVVVMTEFRDKKLKELIESRGGRVSESFSKSVTHLIAKDKNSGSTKILKAVKEGIPVFSVEEFTNEMNR